MQQVGVRIVKMLLDVSGGIRVEVGRTSTLDLTFGKYQKSLERR